MEITVDYLTQRVKYWIDVVYKEPLPVPPISISKSAKKLGEIKYKRSSLGKPIFSDFRLLFSGVFNFTEGLLDDVILHELIHYKILYSQTIDSAPHGKIFRALMKTINQRFGRNITITHRTAPAQPRRKFYYICVGRLTDGRYIVASTPKKDMRAVESMVSKEKSIAQHAWYRTANPYFGGLPSSSTLKAFFVPYEELKKELGNILTV